MGGRPIKKTYTVLHADSILFVLLALLIAGTSFLQDSPILGIVLRCLPFVIMMGVTEALVVGLRMERKIAWIGAALFLVGHFFFALLAHQGFNALGLNVTQGTLRTGIAAYFFVSGLYGFLGLLSGQTLHNFFSRSTTIEKGK